MTEFKHKEFGFSFNADTLPQSLVDAIERHKDEAIRDMNRTMYEMGMEAEARRRFVRRRAALKGWATRRKEAK